MNDVLRLKGPFFSRKSPNAPGAPSLPATADITEKHLHTLADQLRDVKRRWQDGYVSANLLASVYYIRVISKSSRTQRILAETSEGADFTVVGSKFENGPEGIRHVVTHCVSESAIERSIHELTICADILAKEFHGHIDCNTLGQVNHAENKKRYDKTLKHYGMTRPRFSQIIVDTSLVEKYGITSFETQDIVGSAIVTIYDTGEPLDIILDTLRIPYNPGDILDKTTVILSEDAYNLLTSKAPYLVAMSSPDAVDWTNREPEQNAAYEYDVTIPPPKNEPVIGVIDTLFRKDKVYFSDWVEYEELLDKDIEKDASSYIHGTKVTSILVDGPTLNPSLDDGCGRFRVKHFGVANGNRVSTYTILRLIPEIVMKNRSIKVWNLCLGSPLPISKNSISPIAAKLDELQEQYGVVFVVAGTNDPHPSSQSYMPLGSPADSINSIVVNSVKRDGTPASYSRRGPVLSFYGKPDVCYYGGDENEPLTAYAPWGEDDACGTSYAAPWIARKLAYLIYIMDLPKEAAKALLIDSAAGWARESNVALRGYGQVPIRISDILHTEDDEIKFIVTGKSSMYDTYTYRIPVPVSQGKHPYYVKATLCYFPQCSRQQGVDYTKSELDLRIGRLSDGKIKSIDNNMQGEPGIITYEKDARKYFRKWDNVKIVGEEIKQRRMPRKVYGSQYWGISLKAKERFKRGTERSTVSFGIVVTLKEMFGVNRIDEFIRHCEFSQWRVTRLDTEASFNLYNVADEEVEFEE